MTTSSYQVPDPQAFSTAHDLAWDDLTRARAALAAVECAAMAAAVDDLLRRIGEAPAATLQLRVRRYQGLTVTGLYRTEEGERKQLVTTTILTDLAQRLDEDNEDGWRPLGTFTSQENADGDGSFDLDLAKARSLLPAQEVRHARWATSQGVKQARARLARLDCTALAIIVRGILTEDDARDSFDAVSLEMEIRPHGMLVFTGFYGTASGGRGELEERDTHHMYDYTLDLEGRAGWEPLCTRDSRRPSVVHLDLVAASRFPPPAGEA